jgi:hypothetical protein
MGINHIKVAATAGGPYCHVLCTGYLVPSLCMFTSPQHTQSTFNCRQNIYSRPKRQCHNPMTPSQGTEVTMQQQQQLPTFCWPPWHHCAVSCCTPSLPLRRSPPAAAAVRLPLPCAAAAAGPYSHCHCTVPYSCCCQCYCKCCCCCTPPLLLGRLRLYTCN